MLNKFRGHLTCLFLMTALVASISGFKTRADHQGKQPKGIGKAPVALQAESPTTVGGDEFQYVDLSSDPSILPVSGFETNQTSSTVEGFETGSKGSYAAANVTLGTGVWNMSDALIGNLANDRKVGTQSARVQNTGKVTMQFNVNGAGTVSVQHAKYGTDANSTWELWYSTTNGSSWTKVGSTVTTSSTTLQTASFTVNTSSAVRFEIRKVSGGSARLNFDQITITGNSAPPPPAPCTATSITLPATVSGSLASTDCLLSDGSYGDKYSFTASSGQVTITETSSAFDAYVIVDGPGGLHLEDDDSAGGTNARIVLNVTTAGTYTVTASSYNPSTTGAYSLSVSGGSTPPPPPPPSSSEHLTMGNPSGAAANTSLPNNYLMEKAQYALSYNDSRRQANWVSWHLGISDIGSTPRQDDFREDTTLPTGWYRVPSNSFGTGYDRGHMCPSADRTSSVANNSATFLMTNMIPQASDNNQGPWANLENYTRTLLSSGANEIYIISGGSGSKGTISVNGMTIPTRTWKIILVMPAGTNDVSRVTTSTRVIAVNMPNDAGIRSVDWKTYRVSVDSIETLTGYDFLSNVPTSIQSVIEAQVDNQ